MFSFRALRATPIHTHRSRCRPQLEHLEDRVVPSLIPDGWIVETTSPSPFVPRSLWSSLASFPTGIVALDPSTGEQSLVAARSGGLLSRPEAITLVNDMLYVADSKAFGGSIIQVDPISGHHILIAPAGDLIHGSTALAIINGSIYVASGGNEAGTVLPNLAQVNLRTLAQTEISAGGSLSTPVGLVPVPNDDNDIYWADARAGTSGTGEIFEIDLSTGAQKSIAQGNLLDFPAGMAQELDPNSGLPTGNLIVVNAGNGSVVRVSPDGSQSQLSSFSPGSGLNSIMVGSGLYGPGTIFVGAIANGTTPGTLFAVDPRTGNQTAVTWGGDLSRVAGLAFSSDGNTLYVGTSPSSLSTPIDAAAPIGIIGVNPMTGAQSPISVRPAGLFSLPIDICEGPAPRNYLYVADFNALGSGAIIRIDPNDGSQILLATGGYLHGPNSVVYINGYLYVSNVGDASGTTHTIIQIDLNNLNVNTNQTLITDGSGLVDLFTNPVHITPVFGDPDRIYVGDEPGNVGGNLPGQIWKVNLRTGEQSRFGPMFPTAGFTSHLDHIAVDPTTGTLYALTVGSDGTAGSVVRVDSDSLTEISVHDKLIGGNGLIVNPDGTAIYVATIASASQNARILSVDPTDPTGAQSVVTEGFNLSLVGGLRFFRASGGGGRAAPSGRSSTVVPLGTAGADDAGFGRRETGVSAGAMLWYSKACFRVRKHGTPRPQAQLPQLPAQSVPPSKNGEDTGRTLRRATHQVTVLTTAVDSFFAGLDSATIRHTTSETIY